MKKNIFSYKSKSWIFIITTFLGVTSLFLYIFFYVDIFKARDINIDKALKQLAEQRKEQDNNPSGISKVVFEKGSSNKGLDFRCLSWSSKQIYSDWTQKSDDHDFYIDFYVPAGKKAIFCATPAFATSLALHPNKRFLYEVSQNELDDGLNVRIIIGLSDLRNSCKALTGNPDCLDSSLVRQAIVRYEP
ncbi:MAG: hypothetical protein KME64_38200 [Scytonematopsis contorta HA4267-MV1]|jgi:hypothetical protein|nr:hypothetical protein [Scytonematopsis contorta HA4267-MV1]